MAKNTKQSSSKVASIASEVLNHKNASETAKTLAASVLAQRAPSKQTGAKLEDLAAKVLRSNKYSEETKTLAGSVLAQANKPR